jgi:predicted nucleic acid-binding protein
MLSLVDTNILVYRFDSRFPEKQAIATALLRRGIADRSLRIPHQAIIEFLAATTRSRGAAPILELNDARREAEELLAQFEVLYPNESVLRLALRGSAAYQLSWFDANLWAYAEHFALDRILSEDFEHQRLYGAVTVINPFFTVP